MLKGLHRQGIKTAVVSNIAFDVRPAFVALGVADCVDEFVLSFEVGAVKPAAAIFETALSRLGVEAAHAVMVGDSDEADGGARAVGCGIQPRRPAADRPANRRADKSAGRIRRRDMTMPTLGTALAETDQQDLHGAAAARRELRRRAAAGVDGAGPQVGQAPLDADHPDGGRRKALCRSRSSQAPIG